MEKRIGSVSQTFGKNISKSFTFLNLGSLIMDTPNSPVYQYHQMGMGRENRAYPVNDGDGSTMYYEWKWLGEEGNSTREASFFSDYGRSEGEWRGKNQVGEKKYFDKKGEELVVK